MRATLSIPLDEQWEPSTAPLKTIKGGGDFPTANGAALWVDDTEKRLYCWGGGGPFNDDGADDPHLWVFEPDNDGGGKWSVQEPENPEVFDEITRGAGAGYATCGNMAYSLGGYSNPSTDETHRSGKSHPITTLSSFDMKTKSWAEVSTEAFNDPYGTYREGKAVCGDHLAESDPFLVPLGGHAAYDETFDSTAPMDFSNITFYHPDMHGWHWQHTRGNRPQGRTNLCAVGARGPGGSYEM